MSQRPKPTGTKGAVCAKCRRVFTSVSAFDKHQRLTAAGVECREPYTVGLEERTKAGQTVWGFPAWDPTCVPFPWTKAA